MGQAQEEEVVATKRWQWQRPGLHLVEPDGFWGAVAAV